jgi:hypothetical protein
MREPKYRTNPCDSTVGPGSEEVRGGNCVGREERAWMGDWVEGEVVEGVVVAGWFRGDGDAGRESESKGNRSVLDRTAISSSSTMRRTTPLTQGCLETQHWTLHDRTAAGAARR